MATSTNGSGNLKGLHQSHPAWGKINTSWSGEKSGLSTPTQIQTDLLKHKLNLITPLCKLIQWLLIILKTKS